MNNASRQRQLFPEQPAWETLPDEVRPAAEQLLSLMFEHELSAAELLSVEQPSAEEHATSRPCSAKEPNHV